jgi:hypothetical protein
VDQIGIREVDIGDVYHPKDGESSVVLRDNGAVRTVGRRAADTVREEQVLEDVARLQRTLNRLRGGGLVPRGLYRFSSFEDADTWMMRQMAQSAARQSSNTSSPSVTR